MTDRPYRILVTGSRDWADRDAVDSALADVLRAIPADREAVLVSGACPSGADAIAEDWARRYGMTVERHPADWDRHGRAAGPVRNVRMVRLGADICLAFIRDGSRGAGHTARLADAAGIPVRRWTEQARRAAGIDGTAGDAQDIRHRFVRDDRIGDPR